jgi:Family of unknown function (DUF6498)
MTVDTLGRALATYRRTTESRTAIALIVANLIPLVGVLFFGWSLLTILVLYWIENGIVGFWNVPRIILAQGSIVPVLPRLPDAAARSATTSDAAAHDLQAAWEKARAAQLGAQSESRLGSISAAPDLGAPPAITRMFGALRIPTAARVGLAVFFVIHYGIFWLVHGIFVFALPAFLGNGSSQCVAGQPVFPSGTPGGFPGGDVCSSGPFGDIVWSNVGIAALALFLSHGASFLFNYIGAGEYITASPTRQMGAPYGRVVVLHLTILFGAFAVAFLGSPVGALLILVALKTAFDLGLHLRQHHTAAIPLPPGVAGPA